MKLEKAIELCKEAEQSLAAHKFPDHADAVKQGRETMKAVIAWRVDYNGILLLSLPGETDDEERG